jgi:hypothetical protein
VKWAERMARKYRCWGPVIAASRASIICDYPLARDLKHDAFQHQLQRTQTGVDNSWKMHPCTQLEGMVFDKDILQLVESRDVTLMSHAGSGSLKMPLWQCSCCHERFGPNPLAFACFPSTPTAPAYWIDVDVHHQFSSLAMNGTSCTGDSGEELMCTIESCSNDPLALSLLGVNQGAT